MITKQGKNNQTEEILHNIEPSNRDEKEIVAGQKDVQHNSDYDKKKVKKNNKSILKKIKEIKFRKSNLLITSLILILFVFTLIAIINIFSIFSYKKHVDLNPDYSLIQDDSISNEEQNIPPYVSSGAIPILKNKFNPINGSPITEEKYNELINKKIFAVTVNNHDKARPQSGLSQADIVMEVLAEGGITRYVAVFWENEPTKIGPVRSVRRYMLDYLAEFDSPVILHEGGASYNSSNKVYVRETDAIRDINEYHMKSMQTAGSRYRDTVKANKDGYVHSLYTSYQLIESEFDRIAPGLGWESTTNMEEFTNWKYDDLFEERGSGGVINLSFLSYADGWSASGFEYNKYTNSYDRLITGKPDIDALTNTRISPKDVIVEWHDYRPANDGYSRIVITMIGEGPVTIYRDGKVFEGTWKKTDRESRTRYYDNNGNEIELTRGQLWKVILVKTGETKYSKLEYKEN